MSGPPAPPLQEQIATAIAAIRESPEATAPRVALFQLAALTGDWVRARGQLDTLATLDPEYAIFARLYARLIDAEATRARVFAGTEQPVVLGEPPAWLAMMAAALHRAGQGTATAARDLRAQAREAAPARPGRINDAPFAWVMDADPRLGPTLEVVIDGQYRWLPFERIETLRADPPRAMRDLVWQPVTLVLAGRERGAFVPARYPGSEATPDDAIRLARRTDWTGAEGDEQGLGQRMLAADVADHAFLDIRILRFDPPAPGGDA